MWGGGGSITISKHLCNPLPLPPPAVYLATPCLYPHLLSTSLPFSVPILATPLPLPPSVRLFYALPAATTSNPASSPAPPTSPQTVLLQGGATRFDQLGLAVRPRKGKLLLFFPAFADGSADPRWGPGGEGRGRDGGGV